MRNGHEGVVWIVLQHPEHYFHVSHTLYHSRYAPSPLRIVHDSPEDDDKHGDAVDPDVELPGGGSDRLKLENDMNLDNYLSSEFYKELEFCEVTDQF